MADMERYVVKDASLPLLLDRMRASGVKTFLLTNSGFEYSNVSSSKISRFHIISAMFLMDHLNVSDESKGF